MSKISEKLAEVRAKRHDAEDIVRDCKMLEAILEALYSRELIKEAEGMSEADEAEVDEGTIIPQPKEESEKAEEITLDDIIRNEELDELEEATEPVIEEVVEEEPKEEDEVEEADNPEKPEPEKEEIEEAKEIEELDFDFGFDDDDDDDDGELVFA